MCVCGAEIFLNENDVGASAIKLAGSFYKCEALRVDGGLVCLEEKNKIEKGTNRTERERRQRHDAIRAATHNRI